jgi:hypothetical protein
MSSLKDKITSDNLANFIEVLGNHIDLVKIEFESKVLKTKYFNPRNVFKSSQIACFYKNSFFMIFFK